MVVTADSLLYNALFILVIFCLLAYTVMQCGRFSTRGGFKNLWATVKTLNQLLTAATPAQISESDVDLNARASVVSVRTCLVENFSKVAVHALAAMLLWSFVVLFLGAPDVYFIERPFGFTANSAQLFFVIDQLLWFLFCFVFTYWPQLVTFRAMTFLYIVMSIWWAAASLPLLTSVLGQHHRHYVTVNYFPRIVAGFVVGSSRVSVVFNVVLCGVMCCCVAFWPGGGSRIVDTFIREAVCTAILVTSSASFDRWASARARSALDTKSMAMSHATLLRILFALCDAVVTLGPDLSVSQRAPKLANLLSKNEQNGATGVIPRQALVGVSFVDLLVETDRPRFFNFVARGSPNEDPSADPEPARALNVHLRDSRGVARQAQLFHSQFRDENNQVGHFIAVCAIGEILQPSAGPRGVAGVSRNPAVGRRQPRGTSATRSDTSRETPRSVFSTHSVNEATSSIGFIEDESDLSWFGDSVSMNGQSKTEKIDTLAPLPTRSRSEDQIRERLPKLGELEMCFDSLRFRVSRQRADAAVLDMDLLDRQGLLEWISEWPSYRAWMHDFVNAILRPVGPNVWPLEAGPPHQVGFHMSFRARCALPADFLTSQGVYVEGAMPMVAVPRVLVEKVILNPRLHVPKKKPSSNKLGSLSNRSHRSGEAAEVVSGSSCETSLSQKQLSSIERLRENIERSGGGSKAINTDRVKL